MYGDIVPITHTTRLFVNTIPPFAHHLHGNFPPYKFGENTPNIVSITQIKRK